MKAAALFAFMAAAALVAGCADSIHKGWLVDRTRVLGAVVSSATDPARASLAPGERGRISWLVAAPEGTPSFAWTFAACVPPEGNFAAPQCETTVVASGTGTAAGDVIAMDIDVPPEGALGDAAELLVLAAFCGEGTPTLDVRSFVATCVAGEPLLASVIVRLANAGTNVNPRPPSVRIGDALLSDGDPPAAGAPCEVTSNVPATAAGGPAVDLVYVFDGSEREPNESIMLSTMVTAGELDRQYSAFDPDEAAPKEIRVPWTPPGNAGAAPVGRIVRFYVLLRDGRGGASFGRFAVCVRPS